MKARKGCVKLAGRIVGIIEEIDDATRFTYAPDWLTNPDAVPVSVTMPLRPEPYVAKGLLTFFDNLLPEGFFLRICEMKLKIAKEDRFGMLLATCGECVGTVEIEPIGEKRR